MPMEFIASYSTPRKTEETRKKNVFKLTVEQFEKDNKAKFGYRLNEYLDNNKYVRPYYDYDLSGLETAPDNDLINEHLELFTDMLALLHPEKEVAYAQRCGAKPNRGYVISLRAFVKGEKMRVNDIQHHIINTFGEDKPVELDINVYKEKDQCLGVINAYKTQDDRRLLLPITHKKEKRAFLTQYMYGDEIVRKVKQSIMNSTALVSSDSKKSRPIVKNVAGGTLTVNNNTMNNNTLNNNTFNNLNNNTVNNTTINNVVKNEYINYININLPLSNLTNPLPSWGDVQEKLAETFGFTDLQLIGSRENGYNFDACRVGNCPVCKVNKHESNYWYCLQIMPEMFLVKNYSTSCHTEVMELENLYILKNIIQMPDADGDYAKLFAQIYRGVLFWTRDGRFMGYQNNKWQEVAKEEVRECICVTIGGILERMLVYLGERKTWMHLHNATPEALKQIKKEYDNVALGTKYLKRNRHLKDIFERVKDNLWNRDFERDLDADINLIGLDNGILDLVECKFRMSRPEDMVSKTVGYKWPVVENRVTIEMEKNVEHNFDENFQEDIEAEFNTFIEQIYPVEEEREVFQRYCGYCLLGDHREKVMVLLTDVRDGYNGKSTIAKMIMKSFGDYSRRGDNALLYKSDSRHETVNSHSQGMIAYRGYRIAYFEELDSKEKLNNQLIKDLNGGNTVFEGRAAHSTTQERFVWGTKSLMLFNESNFPSFDFCDKSLIDRMLVIRHRSRFYNITTEYEANLHVPFTYQAQMIDENMEIWKPYFLRWSLQGLKNYWIKRFKHLPESCTQFKNDLENEQDVVREFLQERIESYNDIIDNQNEYDWDVDENGLDFCYINKKEDIWITVRELYAEFSKLPTEKNNKTKLGIRKFAKRVEELWNDSPISEKRLHGRKNTVEERISLEAKEKETKEKDEKNNKLRHDKKETDTHAPKYYSVFLGRRFIPYR